MDVNYFSIFRLLVIVVCLGVYLFDIVPRSAREVLEPRDEFTKLRWMIFAVLVTSVITAMPSIVYQSLKAQGIDSVELRNITTISGTIGYAATTTLVWLIFHYKARR